MDAMVCGDVVDTLRKALAAAPPEVVAAYLYGSQARGTARPDSDIDVGILLNAPPASTLKGVARSLEATLEAALRRPTQAVVLNSASPDLVHRVLRDGIILLDRDRAVRLLFEVQARNAYFDMEPIRRLYRRLPA